MKTIRGTWRPVRRDELRTERVHDTYKAALKPEEPARCPDCGAVFRHGRWTWESADKAHDVICPACHRIRDAFPAGYLRVAGPYLADHRDEILRLIRHREQREKAEHPLERIMAIEDMEGGLMVTTTDSHLVRQLGEALHAACKGELEYHYNDGENLLRVCWTR